MNIDTITTDPALTDAALVMLADTDNIDPFMVMLNDDDESVQFVQACIDRCHEYRPTTPEENAADVENQARKNREFVKASTVRCLRCGGSGYLAEFRHVAGGDCFGCNGTGRVDAS